MQVTVRLRHRQTVDAVGAAAHPKQDEKCLVGSRIDVEAEIEKGFSEFPHFSTHK